MTTTSTIEAAKRLHDRYDRAQIARHRLMVPRQWDALPQDCRQEVIDTVNGEPKETP